MSEIEDGSRSTDRRTFLRAAEHLDQLISDCATLRRHVRRARRRAGEDRVRLLLDSLDQRYGMILTALREFRDTGTDGTLDTYLQYAAADRPDVPAPPEDLTVDSVSGWALEANAVVEEASGVMADLAMPASVREAFDNLAAMLEGQSRRTARERGAAKEL